MNKNVHTDTLTNACISFEESLKAFIKDPKSGRAAHLAAQCLFDVRKLENAIAGEENVTKLFDQNHPRRNKLADTTATAANEAVLITVIPPAHKDDL